jgi:dihydroxy-acid dehydratase
VLHVAPEAAIGGPLALVRTGDRVRVDVPARTIDMAVPEGEIARRREAWAPSEPKATRGYDWMFARHVMQADKGCDFDYLETGFGRTAPEPDIF